MKKLKIALLASSLLPRVGGAEVVVHNLAEGLRREKHRVDVITWWGQCRVMRHLVAYPVRPFLPRSFTWSGVGTWKRRGVAGLTMGLQVAFYQARFRYDLWHIHLAFPGAALAAGTLARMGVPFLVTCHGADVQTVPGIRYGLRLNPYVDKAICAALRQATGVAAISRSIREKLQEMGVDPSRIFDVNNGINLDALRARPGRREEARRALGLPSDRKIILTVGRHDRVKNMALIPKILVEVVRTHCDVLWVIAGRENDPIAAEAQQLGVGDHLHVMPEIALDGNVGKTLEFPDARTVNLYHASDVYVMTSLIEGMPLVLMESMAAGLPIVASDVPGCRDLIERTKAGLLADVANPADFAAQIGEVLSDASARRKLIEAGSVAAGAWAWPQVVREHVALYRKICEV